MIDMDRRHRVYYYVSLNQNHKMPGWWCAGWDDYGLIYDKNLDILKKSVPSIKIMPSRLTYKSLGYYQLKISCKKEDEHILLDTLGRMRKTDYAKVY